MISSESVISSTKREFLSTLGCQVDIAVRDIEIAFFFACPDLSKT